MPIVPAWRQLGGDGGHSYVQNEVKTIARLSILRRPLARLLWLVLPVVPMSRQSLPDGRSMPLGLVLIDSIGRLLLVGLIVWFAITSEWIGVLVSAIFLLLMALMRFGTSWLVERLEPKQ